MANGDAYGGGDINHQFFGPQTVTINCKGAITATFTWNGGPNNDPAPAANAVLIAEQVDAKWGGQSGGVGSDLPGGTTTGGPGGQVYTATRYSVQGGSSFSVTCTPTASASSTVPLNGEAGAYANVGYTASVSPVFVTLNGTTLVSGQQEALTGQQITAHFSGLPAGYKISSYTWSLPGGTAPNPIKNWDPKGLAADKVTPQQLFLLTSTDLTGTDISPNHAGIAVADLPFYDQVADTVTVKCTVNFAFPDGTTGTVAPQSQPVKFLKPTAAWTVNIVPPYFPLPIPAVEQPGFYSDNATYMQAYEWWDPINITVPTGFTGGTGCLAQTVTTSRTNTRVPTGTGVPTYTLKIQSPPGSGNWIAPGTGLDGMFPYPKGFPDDGFGHDDQSNPITNGYMWNVSVPGHSQDVPKLAFAPPDADHGGTKWNYAKANDTFNTWLMYQPPANGGGTIWVPLQTLSWNWGGIANGSGTQWTITSPAFSPRQSNCCSISSVMAFDDCRTYTTPVMIQNERMRQWSPTRLYFFWQLSALYSSVLPLPSSRAKTLQFA